MNVTTRLQSYLRENAQAQLEAVAAPPFTLFFHPTEEQGGASYAIPDAPTNADWLAALPALQASFEERDRVPFVRFIHEYAPELDSALQAAGFVEAWHTPLLACTQESLRLPPEIEGLTFVICSSESPLAQVREGWDVNARGFDPDALFGTDEEIEAFRQTLITSRGFTARLDGEAAGAGMWTEVRDGVTELMGIATLVPFRRQGIASALTTHMAQAAFEQGVEIVFLGAASDEAGRVYERVGFERLGTLLGYGVEPR